MSSFGIWARQGSRSHIGRFKQSAEAAAIGAERFLSKLRVADNMVVGPFLTGPNVTIADVVAMSLLEFVQDFYGVPIPASCSRLASWYERFAQRPRPAPAYPPEELKLAHGLPAQTQISV
jgi:glutathione S-transferase